MSTSDSPQQGRKHRHTTTRTPSSAASHRTSNFQAHAANSQTTMEFHPPPPSTPPRTPRRGEGPSVVPAENISSTTNDAAPHVAPNSSVKIKSKTKNRPKHVNTSPSAARNIRATPTLNGTQSAGLPKKTPGAIAYAGPTFHASPAPSALPLPTIFSKSVPESPAPICINSVKDETETSSSGSDSPTPPHTAQLNGSQSQREESPLDFFFMADRAERAKARGSSSGSGPFRPLFESPPTNPLPPDLPRANSAHFSGGRPSSMFAMELDSANSPGKPMGAPFATPYSERMKAVRSSSAQSNKTQEESLNNSQALRDYLFSGSPLPSRSSAPNVATLGTSIRSTSGPSTPVGGPQAARYPTRSYHTDYPFGNESINSSPRTSSRASGLRQQVPHFKTSIKKPNVSERVTSAPPKMSYHSSVVNNGTMPYINAGISQNSTSSAIPISLERSRSDDLLDLEERLRKQLNMGSANQNCDSGFPYGSPDSASRYGASSMNDGYSNGVVGGHHS